MPAYLDARNPENGELIWRQYVTAQKEGEAGLDTWPNLDMAKHGGGMTWQPITYDPELNHIYVTTGNPQPVVAFKNREGANRSQRRSWRWTPTPGRWWHFPVVAARHSRLGCDPDGGGLRRHDRRQAAQAARAGVAERPVLRARSHERQGDRLERARQDQLEPRLRRQGAADPEPGETAADRRALVTPNQGGATNWYPPSFSPQTGLFYVNATRAFSVWYIYDPSDNPMGWGGTDRGGTPSSRS